MRISDWMSDVCSSDLLNFCRLDTHSVAAGKSLEMQPHGRRERRIDDRKTQSASGSLRPRGPGERLQHRLAHAVRQAGARVLHTKTRTIRLHHNHAAVRDIKESMSRQIPPQKDHRTQGKGGEETGEERGEK